MRFPKKLGSLLALALILSPLAGASACYDNPDLKPEIGEEVHILRAQTRTAIVVGFRSLCRVRVRFDHFYKEPTYKTVWAGSVAVRRGCHEDSGLCVGDRVKVPNGNTGYVSGIYDSDAVEVQLRAAYSGDLRYRHFQTWRLERL